MIKKIGLHAILILAVFLLIGCEGKNPQASEQASEAEKDGRVVVGFSQLGAESDWRSAHTQSMKSSLTTQNGFDLIFEDAQQKQSNQIMAIRKFIQQEVDYIVLAPVTEEGWDTVLQEAKDAEIPVIIVDRMVNVSDDSLFTCWVGSDFELEGKKVAEWLNQYTIEKGIDPEELRIVNIQGTIGGTAQIGRTKGLEDAAHMYGWTILAEETGDFTQAKGHEVMRGLLRRYDNINVVYCENDNEAFGAIEAIEEAGKKVGSNIEAGEIMVVSFDGVKQEAINDVLDDKISCIAECNPLHGPLVQSLIETLERGETPDKLTYVDEGIFSANETVQKIKVEDFEYTVRLLDWSQYKRPESEN